MGSQRFLTLSDVADLLNVSVAQAYALVRGGELAAVKVGGRGQWRVEAARLEQYIARLYDQTATFIAHHPYGRPDLETGEPVGATGHLGAPHTEPPRTQTTAL